MLRSLILIGASLFPASGHLLDALRRGHHETWVSTSEPGCPGDLVSELTLPTRGCQPVPGQPTLGIILICNTDGNNFTSEIYQNTKCDGTPMSVSLVKAHECQPDPSSRGRTVIYNCNATQIHAVYFSLQPATPTGLQCGNAAGAAAGQLPVTVKVDAAKVDEVAFAVGFKGIPYLTYTVPVGTSGAISTMVPGLLSGVRFTVQARAHRRLQHEGNPDTWSNLTAVVECTAGSIAFNKPSTADATTKGVNTRWIEVYRSAPDADFLDQHNTFDFVGMGSTMALFSKSPGPITISRYCVELEDVILPAIITEDVEGRPQPSHFSDYQSCDKGKCVCMGLTDHTWTRRPKANIFEQCHAPSIDNTTGCDKCCQCALDSLEKSSKYIGRAPTPLPMSIHFELGSVATFPVDYPNPTVDSPMGYVYHFPGASKCKPGTHVGDHGCTWQRSPSAFTVSASKEQLAALGVNSTLVQRAPGDLFFPKEASIQNIAVFGALWEKLMPLDMPICGSAHETQRSSAIVV